MHTRIVSEEPPLSVDAALLDRLDRLGLGSQPPWPSEFPAIRVGVEGTEGRLYRIIETTSVVEAVRVFEILKDLGLRPDEHQRRHGHKVTRLYRPGP